MIAQNPISNQNQNIIDTKNELYLLSKSEGFNFYNKLVTLNELREMEF